MGVLYFNDVHPEFVSEVRSAENEDKKGKYVRYKKKHLEKNILQK